MPTSTAAPKTGRDITKRVLLGCCAAFAMLTGGPALAVTATPPPAVSTPPPGTGQLAFYMMQGNAIISQPYTSATACFTALAAFRKKLPPAGVAPIVCAHRRP